MDRYVRIPKNGLHPTLRPVQKTSKPFVPVKMIDRWVKTLVPEACSVLPYRPEILYNPHTGALRCVVPEAAESCRVLSIILSS
jgi:hypothetical protein